MNFWTQLAFFVVVGGILIWIWSSVLWGVAKSRREKRIKEGIERVRRAFLSESGPGSKASEFVNSQLAQHAHDLADVFRQEIECLVALSAANSTTEEVDLEARLRKSKIFAAEYKKNFWDAWQLAKDMGFGVKRSYKDYLSHGGAAMY